MNWSSWSDFLAMGGYGLYVWGSLAMCALAPLIEISLLAARSRATQNEPDEGMTHMAERNGV